MKVDFFNSKDFLGSKTKESKIRKLSISKSKIMTISVDNLNWMGVTDAVNKALDLMQENGVKVFAIVSNQGGVEAGFVSGADIEAKIEYVLRSVHDLAVKRGIRGVLYEKRLCYSNDEQNPMRKPNTVMRGMNFSQLKGCSLMVGDASGLPGQFSDSDKVCAENAGIDYMDVITFVGK